SSSFVSILLSTICAIFQSDFRSTLLPCHAAPNAARLKPIPVTLSRGRGPPPPPRLFLTCPSPSRAPARQGAGSPGQAQRPRRCLIQCTAVTASVATCSAFHT